jgi:hypothetical protein
MLKWILLLTWLAFVFCSCSRNLVTDITLGIDDTGMNFHVGSCQYDEEYFHPADSTSMREDVLNTLKEYFNEKGNDVTVVTNGTYTLKILSCNFYETATGEFIPDPCDTVPPYDTLRYQVHSLTVNMHAVVYDSMGNYSEIIEAESSDEEHVKDHPTVLQSMFGNDDCYCPRVKHIIFVDKLRKRVLRRIHRRVMFQIKSWQRSES